MASAPDARRARSRSPTTGSATATMDAASSAAFSPFPTPTVATGTPFGIWTIARSASRPSEIPPAIGTPITGSVVCDASTPGRCAASPAIAMKQRIPRASAPAMKRARSSGARCAEMTRISESTPSSSRTAIARSAAAMSERLPTTIPTRAVASASLPSRVTSTSCVLLGRART
jgi:hypothetical protein